MGRAIMVWGVWLWIWAAVLFSQEVRSVSTEIERLRQEIETAMQARQYDVAVTLARQAALLPGVDHGYWQYLTALSLFYQNKLDVVGPALQPLLADTKNLWWHKANFLQARIYLARREYAQAATIYAQATHYIHSPERKQTLAQIYLQFAQALSRKPLPHELDVLPPDYPRAYLLYEKALDLKPGPILSEEILFSMCKLRLAEERWDEATPLLTRYLEQHDPDWRGWPGQSSVSQAQTSGKYCPEARLLLADSLLHSFSIEQATAARQVLQDLLALLETRPRPSPTPELPNLAEEILWKITRTYYIAFLAQNDLATAIASLRRYLEKFPQGRHAVQAAYDIGAAYLYHKQTTLAIQALEEFLAGTGYRVATAVPDAKTAATSVALETPEQEHLRLCQEATYQLGQLYAQQQAYAKAIAIWRDYTVRFPNGKQWAQAQQSIVDTEYREGEDLVASHQYEKSKSLWAKFMAQYPLDQRHPQILYILGQIHYQFATEEQAKQQAGQPRQSNRPVAELFGQAIAQWEKLIAQYPDSVPAQAAIFRCGRVYEEDLGDLAKALAAYRQVQDGQWAAQAQERMGQMTQKRLSLTTERTFRTHEPAKIKLELRNIKNLTVSIYRLNLQEYFQKQHTILGIEALDLSLIEPDKAWDVEIPNYRDYLPLTQELEIPMTGPSVYAVNVSDGTLEATTLVIRSDLELIFKSSRRELLVFVQNMRDLKPVVGAQLVVSDGNKLLARGQTNDQGVWLHRFSDRPGDSLETVSVLAVQNGHVASNLASLKELGIGKSLSPKGYLFSDRPAYSPGETVKIRALVRDVQDGRFVLPKKSAWRLSLFDPQGRCLAGQPVTLSAFGSCHEEFALSPQARNGSYRLVLSRQEPGKELVQLYDAHFMVEPLRLEKIRLTLTFPQRVVFRGEKLEGSCQAKYYYGNPVVGKTIRVVSQANGQIFTGPSDRDGRFVFSLDTTPFTPGTDLVFTATLAEEGITVRETVKLAKAGFTIALQPSRTKSVPGDNVELTLTTRDIADQPLAAQIVVTVYRQVSLPPDPVLAALPWLSAHERNKSAWSGESKVAERTVVSDAVSGIVRTTFTLADGGDYVFRAVSKDRMGNPVTAATTVTVALPATATVPLQIVAPRHHLKLGEKIEVEVNCQLPQAVALLTLEGATIIEYRIVPLIVGRNPIQLTMGHDHFPNFQLSLAVMRHNQFYQATQPFTVERELKLQVKLDKTTYAPGHKARARLLATDQLGNPVAAEVSLALVDEALFGVYPEQRTPIVPFFQKNVARDILFATETSCTFAYQAKTRDVVQAVLEEKKSDGEKTSSINPPPQVREETITIDVRDKPLGEIIMEITEQTGQNIYFDDEVKETLVSIDLPPDLPWRTQLNIIAKKYHLLVEDVIGAAEPIVKITKPPKVTMDLDGADIQDIQDILSQITTSNNNQNIVTSEAVKGYISLRLQNKPWQDALEAALKTRGYVLVRDSKNRILRVEKGDGGKTPEKFKPDDELDTRQIFNSTQEIPDLKRFLEAKRKIAKIEKERREQNLFRREAVALGFWQPAIVTDPAGEAQVEFTLPDKTTEWRLTAIGCTVETLVGECRENLTVRKNFFVDLKLPEFLVEGDGIRALARVHNLSDYSGPVSLLLTLQFPDQRRLTQTKEIQVAAASTTEWVFDPETVPAAWQGEIQVTATVPTVGLRDSLMRTIPVRPWGVAYASHASGQAKSDTTVVLTLPPRRYQSQWLTVVVAPTVSRTILDLALGDFRPMAAHEHGAATFGATPGDLLACAAALKYLHQTQAMPGDYRQIHSRAQTLVASLVATQRTDGGWPLSHREADSHVTLSARALWALAKAQQVGVQVPTETIAQATHYLQTAFAALPYEDDETKAMIQYVLALLGKGDFGYANRLYRQRASLKTAGLAYTILLLSALDKGEMAIELAETLERQYRAGAHSQSPWSETGNDSWTANPVETTALPLLALATVRPTSPLVPQAAQCLLSLRQGAGFTPYHSQGTAVLALAQYYGLAQYVHHDYVLTLRVNGQFYQKLLGRADSPTAWWTIPPELVVAGPNRLNFELAGNGSFTYAATLHGFAPDLEDPKSWEYPCLAKRRYYHAPLEYQGKALSVASTSPVTQLESGQITQVELALQKEPEPTARQGVNNACWVVEEPLPAGTILVKDSVVGAFSHYEVAPGQIRCYFSPTQPLSAIRYRLVGYAPGSYRVLPTIIRDWHHPSQMRILGADQLTVLAPGQPSSDPYVMNSRELYHLGMRHFHDGQLPMALTYLTQLLDRFPAETPNDVARMLLWIYSDPRHYDARKVVENFEQVKEREPTLYIPFDKILLVGRAYQEIREYERAYLVLHATLEASFVEEAKVAGVLEQQGEFLGASDYLQNLWRDYHDSAAVVATCFGISQTLFVHSGRVIELQSNLRLADLQKQWQSGEWQRKPNKISQEALMHEAITLLHQFRTLYPESTQADDAAFSLASAHLTLRRFSDVIVVASQARRDYPQSHLLSSFSYMEALGHFSLRQYLPAIEQAKAVAEGESKDKEFATFILGQIYHAQDDVQQAVDCYQRVSDRFPEARQAQESLESRWLKLPQLTQVLTGQPLMLELEYRNLQEVQCQIYRVDLMQLAKLPQSSMDIGKIRLAGITPVATLAIPLGNGQEYQNRKQSVLLPLVQLGAYLVICRGDELFASGLAVVTPLQIQVREDAAGRRVRVSLFDQMARRKPEEIQVQVIGSAGAPILGKTDLRGIFVAEKVTGTVTVIAHDQQHGYAFYQGQTWLGPKPRHRLERLKPLRKELQKLEEPTKLLEKRLLRKHRDELAEPQWEEESGQEELEKKTSKQSFSSNIDEFNQELQRESLKKLQEQFDSEEGVQLQKAY